MSSKLDKYKNIFNPTGCLSEEQILRYYKKSLSHKETHEIERHLLDCQLCSDALEGLASIDHEAIIEEIHDKIRSQTNPEKINFNYKSIAIAALLIMSFGISYFIYQKIADSKKPENLVTNSESNQKPENIITDAKEDSSLKDSINIEINKEVIKQPETPQNNLIATLPEKKKELQLKKEDKILDIPPQPKSEVINLDQNDQKVSYSAEESSNIIEGNYGVDTTSESVYTATVESENLSETPAESEVQPIEKLELGKAYYAAPSSMERNKSIESKAAKQVDSRDYEEKSDTIGIAETSTLSSDNLFSNAMEKYNSKEYKEAVVMFQSMLQNNPKNDEVIYYAALSYYNIQEFKMSVKYFEIITKNKKSSFFEGSQWHLALSYIANNEINKAKKLLKLIIDEQGKYELEAQQQLEKMK